MEDFVCGLKQNYYYFLSIKEDTKGTSKGSLRLTVLALWRGNHCSQNTCFICISFWEMFGKLYLLSFSVLKLLGLGTLCLKHQVERTRHVHKNMLDRFHAVDAIGLFLHCKLCFIIKQRVQRIITFYILFYTLLLEQRFEQLAWMCSIENWIELNVWLFINKWLCALCRIFEGDKSRRKKLTLAYMEFLKTC